MNLISSLIILCFLLSGNRWEYTVLGTPDISVDHPGITSSHIRFNTNTLEVRVAAIRYCQAQKTFKVTKSYIYVLVPSHLNKT